ncbi:putative ribonuclease H-like domain-containing protein [Tanacetum coccineum]|uniref:Ribonuclease H-like domain-containing protein n=1 Tax=Tanacetum coccineum TaxID=301880 RepID=A0ABQ5ER59_9ASTR
MSDRVLALETDLRQTKKVYGTAYTKLIMKVKKLEKTIKTSQARRRAKIVDSDDDMALEDSSKQGRMIVEIDQDVGVTLVTPTKVSSQEDQPEDQLGVLSAAKVLADAARVHTYSRRRRAVSTGSGGVSTASSIASTAGMIQQVNIIIPSSSTTKDKEESQRIARDAEIAQRLQEEIDAAEKQRMAQVHQAAQGFTEDECEDIRARFEADKELTQKLQAKERDKYSEVDQARMLTEDKERESELAAGSSKRPKTEHDEEHDEESVKKQKLKKNDAKKEELRACLDIVLGDEIAMDFESLATKYLIIDWKTHILTEYMMYYQIIRADGSFKNYKIFCEMLDDFDRQDVVDLHSTDDLIGRNLMINKMNIKFKGNPQYTLQDQGIFDSGCSRHMTGNKSFLTDYQEIDGGFVAFGGSPKGGKITGKGKIRTGKLDFEDVYFVKELKFNLFSVSQMCDKKNSVLFTKTECLVLSLDFKLLDESQGLLTGPRQNNMYSFDLKNVVPSEDLTCLFAKATIDESNLWHKRLGHINFKTMNKLVRVNLVRDSLLPTTFWAEADNTACYVQNRVLVTKPHNKTLYELLLGRPPSISFMRPFGCPMTILNTLDTLGKFDGKADEGFLVGYSIHIKAFRVFNSRTRKVEENLHINFLENKPNVAGSSLEWLFDIDSLTKSMNYEPVIAGNQTNGDARIETNVNARQVGHEKASDNEYILLQLMLSNSPLSSSTQSTNDKDVDEKEGYAINTNRDSTANLSVSTVGPSINTASENINTGSPNINIASPISNDSSMQSLENTGIFDDAYNDREVGAEADLNNLETTMNVWTLVDLPKGKRAIGTKWVYRNKKDESGIVVRNKARLVAQGYTQEEGIDYDEVFALIARIEAIRLFLAYTSFMGFIVYQMDVKSAFLCGTIEEEVYVCQLPGFEDPQFPNKVYKVEKALYGLHQALRAWYETLSTYLLENGFRIGTIDKTLFIKKDRGDILLVQVYVDDIIIGPTKKSLCVEFERMMHKRFQMSSMGELTFFLGLQVQQKEDGIFSSQDKYVADILKKFDFVTVKTTSTPMEPNKALVKDEEAEDVDVHLYKSMIKSLMYLTTSRTDITFAVCACAREVGAKADLNNLETTMNLHQKAEENKSQRLSKLPICLFSLTIETSEGDYSSFEDPSWIEAMQEELL